MPKEEGGVLNAKRAFGSAINQNNVALLKKWEVREAEGGKLDSKCQRQRALWDRLVLQWGG